MLHHAPGQPPCSVMEKLKMYPLCMRGWGHSRGSKFGSFLGVAYSQHELTTVVESSTPPILSYVGHPIVGDWWQWPVVNSHRAEVDNCSGIPNPTHPMLAIHSRVLVVCLMVVGCRSHPAELSIS